MRRVGFPQHLPPNERTGQCDQVEQFDVRHATPDRMASITAYGISGQLTSNQANIIVADDVETSENARTPDSRDSMRHRVTEFENVMLPGGEIIFLGTSHNEDSIYDHLRSWATRSGPTPPASSRPRRLIRLSGWSPSTPGWSAPASASPATACASRPRSPSSGRPTRPIRCSSTRRAARTTTRPPGP